MFTGIITDIGTITAVEERGDLRLTVATAFDTSGIAIGASVACSGVCLTVVAKAAGSLSFDVSAETRRATAMGLWQAGARLNLERALKVGDELGGHIVTGHVDAVGKVASREEIGGSLHVKITAPAEIAPYIATKGSITVDGVSLTVNALDDHADGSCDFHLNLIPHTADVTTLGDLRAGDAVNLEIDVLARYLQRLQSLRG